MKLFSSGTDSHGQGQHGKVQGQDRVKVSMVRFKVKVSMVRSRSRD